MNLLCYVTPDLNWPYLLWSVKLWTHHPIKVINCCSAWLILRFVGAGRKLFYSELSLWTFHFNFCPGLAHSDSINFTTNSGNIHDSNIMIYKGGTSPQCGNNPDFGSTKHRKFFSLLWPTCRIEIILMHFLFYICIFDWKVSKSTGNKLIC